MSGTKQDQIRAVVLSVLGSGFAPIASGTFGSAAAVLIFVSLWYAARIAHAPRWAIDVAILLPGILLACVISIRWGDWAIARWGRKDPKPFVLDEFAGQWVALLVLPALAYNGLLPAMCVIGGQFFLFRFFDVLKPPPADWIDRSWPSGWGILCDDLVAGLYANLVGQALWLWTPAGAWLGLTMIRGGG